MLYGSSTCAGRRLSVGEGIIRSTGVPTITAETRPGSDVCVIGGFKVAGVQPITTRRIEVVVFFAFLFILKEAYSICAI